jgi:uncharacterized OB-fold protein
VSTGGSLRGVTTDVSSAPSAAVAGHGAAVGRLRDERGNVRPGPDEDALTLATEAAFQALQRSGDEPVAEVLLAAPVCSPADAETLLAALRLDPTLPVRRVPDALEAVALAIERGGRILVTGSDGATAGALVVDRAGYATVSAAQVGGGAPLVDRTRDPRFDRHAGLTAVLRHAGADATSPSPLVAVAELLDMATEGVVASGGPARASTLAVTAIGAAPRGGGADLEALRAAGRPPTSSEARWKPSPRPRGATGVDPDGPLLWRERAELLGPLAARCLACGAMNAPIAGAVLCRRCGHLELEVVPLPRGGTVLTFCVSMTLPRAFAGPLAMIYARLDDGTMWKALAPGLSDDDLLIGDRVELVLRRLVVDDGTPVYGLAFRKALVGMAEPDGLEQR